MLKLLKNSIKKVLHSASVKTFCRKYILNSELAEKEKKYSYAQAGEDKVLQFVITIFCNKNIENLTYVDIGGNDPVCFSNTYMYYLNGGRGVIIEPNSFYADKFRQIRPNDLVIEAGIAFEPGVNEADYYQFPDSHNGLNTFSAKRAEQVKQKYDISWQVLKKPLVELNKIFADYYPQEPPHIVSIDVEGLELGILKTINFERYRPWIYCIESDQRDFKYGIQQSIIELMESNNYIYVANTSINFIFVAKERFTLNMLI